MARGMEPLPTVSKRGTFSRRLFVAAISFSILLAAFDALAESFPRVMFVFDASGSMWGEEAQGSRKIDAAKETMAQVVPEIPPEVELGLMAYGHRRKGDCSDIEVLAPLGSFDRRGLLEKVESVSPKGKTPIAASVRMAAELLGESEDETTVVLISDGEETCDPDPCGVVETLKNSGAKFVLHVVGFGVDAAQREQLSCLAKAGGGRYFGADGADGLLAALDAVRDEVAEKVEKAKTATKKVSTKLGKLEVAIPEESLRCLGRLKIVRASDGKVLKDVDSVKARSTHPLLAGRYEIVAGYANSNYKPDSEVSLGEIEIVGGETAKLEFGALAIDMAESLRSAPAGAVMVLGKGDSQFELITPYTGNSYYFYLTKPLPPGVYDFAVHYKKDYSYKTSETPVVLARDIVVKKGETSTVAIDSGIRILEPEGSSMGWWNLTPAGGDEEVLKIVRASNGAYPLWKTYAVPPGVYDIWAAPEGMDEALPVGESVRIESGRIVEFDTGF